MAFISEGYNPDKTVMICGCGAAGQIAIIKAISDKPKIRQIVVSESTVRPVYPPAMALIDDNIDMPYKPEILIYALGMAAADGMLPRRLFPKDRPYKKCLLPGCEKQTNHRGGYCCAEHCKEHRKKL